MRASRSFAALRTLPVRDACSVCTHVRPSSVITTKRACIARQTQLRLYSSSLQYVKATSWSSMTPHKADAKSSASGTPATPAEPRKNVRAYIALGSNLGDRVEMIERALNEMPTRGIRVLRTSSLWETEPMYVLEQDRFINGACEVETDLEPLELLDALQDIENTMGRHKVIDKGPRNIDLDVLLYDNIVYKHSRLNIPHIGIAEREFVLRPLAELVPAYALDSNNPWKLVQDFLNDLPPSEPPLSTVTPLSPSHPPIQGLKRTRPTHIMSILNVTPDSFSDGGVNTASNISTTIAQHLGSGATILDIGGQSSAPGTPDVTAEEEMARVVPVVNLIRNHSDPVIARTTISIDTYRAPVAEAALAAGADIINDISAGQLDPAMLATVARSGKSICLMHMRGTPATMNSLAKYDDYAGGVIEGVATELLQRIAEAEAAGIRRWRIILDPGIGFAKTQAQNLEILRHLDELREWPGLRGLPWLLGTSRKSFIGRLTGQTVATDRVWGTAATVAASVQGGADIVRVHDVGEMAQVAKVADAIWRV